MKDTVILAKNTIERRGKGLKDDSIHTQDRWKSLVPFGKAFNALLETIIRRVYLMGSSLYLITKNFKPFRAFLLANKTK
jgi:hypothetical protein